MNLPPYRGLSLLVLLYAVSGWSQAPNQNSQPQGMGVNTGGTHAPILDSEKRPITAGGFVKTGPIVFQDVAAKAGLTSWHHTMGTPEKKYILEAPGSGVALFDYDKDG
jgi:enediyne biosynthesis protein E4